MQWIYLSPHLDDVALSCGGWVWQQAQLGLEPQVWTICAGDPPAAEFSAFAQSLHQRWQTPGEAAAQRREEDRASCQAMGAGHHHFSLPDCIYRLGPPASAWEGQALYASEESLWGEVHPAEQALVEWLSNELQARLPADCQVVSPLGLGGHVDHRLVRRAAEAAQRSLAAQRRLPFKRRLWYYADYPYALKSKSELETARQAGWQETRHPLSPPAMQAWMACVAAHRSQISTFWSKDSLRRVPAEEAMRQALAAYAQELGGIPLWQAPLP